VTRCVRGEMGDGPWMRDAPALGFSGAMHVGRPVSRARGSRRGVREENERVTDV